MRKMRITRPDPVTVGEFYEGNRTGLKLELLGSDVGFSRPIPEPTVNRPGLALAGFFTYFAYKRIQVIGNSEQSYLKTLSPENCRKRFDDLCRKDIPCIVLSRGRGLPPGLLELANERGISVLGSPMISMKFINAATLLLERVFAPTTKEHGCMVDIQGIGILIRGDSGSGKSESVLGLLERGASLVADDVVELTLVNNRELVGRAPDLLRFHMEVRGIGLINAAAIFGVGCIREEKRLDLVITLKPSADLNSLERVGAIPRTHQIMGIKIPHMELPVAPGRSLARLIEVAALDQKLKLLGHDAAVEFNKNLLKKMGGEGIG